MAMEPFESARNLNEDVGLFEAAVHAQHMDLMRYPLDALLVAPDGSNQDETARDFAAALARSTSFQIHEHGAARSAADILEACVTNHANLLVVPVPFGRDIDVLKDESLGSVVDMLLLEAPCPVLCVRQLMDRTRIASALSHVLIPVTAHDPAAIRAASWAFRLVAPRGQLELLAIADRDAIDEARLLLDRAIDPRALDAEALKRTVTDEIGGLVAAVQKRAQEEHVAILVECKVSRFVQAVLEEANRHPRLIVVGAPKDHRSPAYHRAVDLVLGAAGPVLVV